MSDISLLVYCHSDIRSCILSVGCFLDIYSVFVSALSVVSEAAPQSSVTDYCELQLDRKEFLLRSVCSKKPQTRQMAQQVRALLHWLGENRTTVLYFLKNYTFTY